MRLRRAFWVLCAGASLSCNGILPPTGPAWTPQAEAPAPPMLVLVDYDSGSVSIFDTSTKDVVATIAVADRVGATAVSGDGRTVYAAVPGGIAVIDVASRTVAPTLTFGGDPSGLTVAGGVLYVTESGVQTGTVSVFDLATGRVTSAGKIRSLVGQAEITVDGQRLFIPHPYYTGFVTVLDTATLRERQSLEFEDRMSGMRLSPDERWLLVPNGLTSDGRVAIIDTVTLRSVGNIALAGEPSDLVIAPDGKRAWVTQFRDHSVAVSDLVGRTVEQTIAVSDYPSSLAVSPDGATLFVVHNGSNRLSVIDVATGAVDHRQLATSPVAIARPSRFAGAR